MNEFILSKKFIDFLKYDDADTEFLEGTTFAGKTTIGVPKFMFKVSRSEKKFHILAGLDLGTIEKNIIQKDNGIIATFGSLVDYRGSGDVQYSMPHIKYKTQNGEKIIFVVGYDNKARWKKVLGGQYGCLYIDEFNIADMEFVREVFMRCDYRLCTMNPDDPNKECYSQFVNYSRPIEKYKNDAPDELLKMLNQPPKDKWVWWYFSFNHNASLSEEKKKQVIESVPKGTKLYKNKILGLRGKATGLVFSNFDRNRHVISKKRAMFEDWQENKPKKPRKYKTFVAGLDTSYSSNSADTIAMTFIGITEKHECILLDEKIYNNRDLDTPIAPSDTIENLIAFLDRNREEWGFARNVYIDSADAGTITEANKYKRNNPCLYNFVGAYKKVQIIDRINLQLGWLHKDYFLIVEHCKNYIQELETYSWKEDKDNEPEDANDHLINSCQYAWIPHRMDIGIEDYVPKEIYL